MRFEIQKYSGLDSWKVTDMTHNLDVGQVDDVGAHFEALVKTSSWGGGIRYARLPGRHLTRNEAIEAIADWWR